MFNSLPLQVRNYWGAEGTLTGFKSIDESKAPLKFDFRAGQGYFAIALFALIAMIFCVCMSCWCGCSPAKLARKREERVWKTKLKELKRKQELQDTRDQRDIEDGLEAEGWTSNGSRPGGQLGLPRLVEGA